MKRAEKKTATRDALMGAALALFARHGYEETTVAQIAGEAGVAKGTFFNYFQTKEDVLVQVVEVQLEWVVEQLHRLESTQDSVPTGVRDLMILLVTRLPYTAPLLRAMFRSSLTSPASATRLTGPSITMIQAMVPIMTAGQVRGELRRDIAAERLAFLAAQTYFGVLWAWCMGPADEPLGPVMALSFDAFFHGVCQALEPESAASRQGSERNGQSHG